MVIAGEHEDIELWLERRRVRGQDHADEVWEGVYHAAPNAPSWHGRAAIEVMFALRGSAEQAGLVSCAEFNLGTAQDYRVPDGGWLEQAAPAALYVPTAVAILEVLSPGDESYAKLGFYARHGVREAIFVDPLQQAVHCWKLDGPTAASEESHSAVFAVDVDALSRLISW